ncbi:hypothetical protein HQ529_02590 [Candidatus Woesearchaeota archaeon]|nr:hypothetical protein [Candidatus Woesearchaeota archaeon]
MIIKIQSDKQKAKSLIEIARITLKRLKETDKEKYPSNTLTDYYDIIRKLMEALTSLEGIKIKGEGAHKQIIDYVCDKYNLNQAVSYFIQDMREYRNRISYEGLSVKKDYIKINAERIEEIISVLLKIIDREI